MKILTCRSGFTPRLVWGCFMGFRLKKLGDLGAFARVYSQFLCAPVPLAEANPTLRNDDNFFWVD